MAIKYKVVEQTGYMSESEIQDYYKEKWELVNIASWGWNRQGPGRYDPPETPRGPMCQYVFKYIGGLGSVRAVWSRG